MAKFLVCLTSVAKAREAHRIAQRLVRRKLAACVSVISGVVSHYRWKGKLHRDREWVLVIKTTSSKRRALEKEISKVHPYELPEFLVLPVAGGSDEYLKWIQREIRGA